MNTNPLGLSAAARRFTNAALAIETGPSAATAGTIGFAPRLMAQFALPYRAPEGTSLWVRRNGGRVMTLQPSTQMADDGEMFEAFPYGVVPRYLLTWMATQAVRTQNPSLSLGSSLNAYLGQIGITRGGENRRLFREQVARLVDSKISIKEFIPSPGGTQIRGTAFTIAEEFNLWVPSTDHSPDEAPENVPAPIAGRMVWPDTLTLTHGFYRELVNPRARGVVPVDLRVMGALSGSPMAIDIYVWLTYRMSYLKAPSMVPWKLLAEQFGSQAGADQSKGRERRFRQTFRENYERKVRLLYPNARVAFMKSGVRLHPSPPSIPKLPKQSKKEA